MGLNRREVERIVGQTSALSKLAAKNDAVIKDALASAKLATDKVKISPGLAKLIAENDAKLNAMSSNSLRIALEQPPARALPSIPMKSGHAIVREGIDEVNRGLLILTGAVESLTDAVGVLTKKSDRHDRILIWLTVALVVFAALTVWLGWVALRR